MPETLTASLTSPKNRGARPINHADRAKAEATILDLMAQGHSLRRIERLCGINRDIVRETYAKIRASGVCLPELSAGGRPASASTQGRKQAAPIPRPLTRPETQLSLGQQRKIAAEAALAERIASKPFPGMVASTTTPTTTTGRKPRPRLEPEPTRAEVAQLLSAKPLPLREQARQTRYAPEADEDEETGDEGTMSLAAMLAEFWAIRARHARLAIEGKWAVVPREEVAGAS